jgi:hypothetical protein
MTRQAAAPSDRSAGPDSAACVAHSPDRFRDQIAGSDPDYRPRLTVRFAARSNVGPPRR